MTSQHNLAVAYLANGQVQKAVKLIEYILIVQEKVLAEEHLVYRLASQHNLAVAYLADGQVQKAIKLMEHVLIAHEKVLVEEHPARLAS